MTRRVLGGNRLRALIVAGLMLAGAVAAQAPPSGRKPRVWAVVIGIGVHNDPLIPDSPTAVADAGQMLAWLQEQGGWDRTQTLFLSDVGSRQTGTVVAPRANIAPIRENLDWAFREWLPAKARAGDLVVVYYAGRVGAVASAAGPRPESSTEVYLLPTGAAAADVAATGWSLDQALDRFVFETEGRCPVVCWLATSTATGLVPGAAPAPLADPAVAGREWVVRLARWRGVSAWLASDRPPDNPARDLASEVFTQALIDGLGRPDRPQNLAACLRSLQQNPTLRGLGFQATGGLPPRLTVWSEQFGLAVAPPVTEPVLQVGHAQRVTAIAVTSDGQRAITAGLDSTLRVWSVKDQALLQVLTGHEVGATSLALGGDGRWLISGGGRPASGVLFHDGLSQDFRRSAPERQPHDKGVVRVAFLPDNRHAVSIDQSRHAVLWDLTADPPTSVPWPGGLAHCLDVVVGGGAREGKVAVLGDDGTVRVFGPSGSGDAAILRWDESPRSVALDPSARRLAVGFAGGKVVVRDLDGPGEFAWDAPAGPVSQLVFSVLGGLAVAHGQGLTLLSPPSGDPAVTPGPPATLAREPAEQVVFAPDGLHLAARSNDPASGKQGVLRVWRVGPKDCREVFSDLSAGASAVAFTGDSRAVVTGGFTGAVGIRPLAAAPDAPRWTSSGRPAGVRRLASSKSRRLLLLVDDVDRAAIWDLTERTCRRLPGRWRSGAFLDDDTRLVLTPAPAPGAPGRPVLVRLEAGAVALDRGFFQPTAAGFALPEGTALVGLTLAPDGARVAATADADQEPLVCVWESATGRLTHRITAAKLDDPVSSLSFSSDGRHLLTAGGSPEARLWDLNAGAGEPAAPVAVFRDPAVRSVTAAAICPGPAGRVVTGHRDGLLRLWRWREREGQAEPDGPPTDLAVGVFSGAVQAITFVADGPNTYLAASGDGTQLWLARMAEPQPVPVGDLGPLPHHAEQVRALTAWPAVGAGDAPRAATLISGGDDTTVKVWGLTGGVLRLRATFASAGNDEPLPLPAPAPGGPDALAELDWVVYTPDGHFDASARGRRLVWLRQGGQARPMEQFDDTKLHTFDLGARLLEGRPVETAATPEEPAPIAIEPLEVPDPTRPDAKVTLRLGSAALRDLRLYHNEVPVATGLETRARDRARAAGEPAPLSVPVRLVTGRNRFYAMATPAAREGSFDSRSPVVEVSYDGPTEPGKVHVLAVGIGDYRRRRLKFAARDAEQISEALRLRGVKVPGQQPGARLVRYDREASVEGVTEAFDALAEAVKGRPQDTVVVFLAGHTGVFEDQQFCLLLPDYPFPAEAPEVVAARDVVTRKGARDAGPVDPAVLLPYAVIEANLMRLDALNRLVILDACQAESIGDDQQVKEIRRWMEVKSRRARTAYLLAARRGEPAIEVEGLRHGLFTYSLLRGMRAPSLDRAREPREIAALGLPDDADADQDGVVTTTELDAYARRALPALARVFPQIMTRDRDEAARGRPDLPALRPGDLDQALRVQAAVRSFPLVTLPAAP